jgi:hypothetical protein
MISVDSFGRGRYTCDMMADGKPEQLHKEMDIVVELGIIIS